MYQLSAWKGLHASAFRGLGFNPAGVEQAQTATIRTGLDALCSHL